MNLRILVPEATTNYITNPSIRYATTGWNDSSVATSTDIRQSYSQARFGFTSLRVNGLAIDAGTYYRVSSLSGVQGPVTASVYVRGGQDFQPTGKSRIRLRLLINPTGKEYTTRPINISSKRWTRLTVTGTLIGSNDVRLYVENASSTAVNTAFYLDGAQIETKHYATTYCDGDQPGCRWNLIAHESTSSRDGFTRAGGKWVPLAGPCRPNNDIYVTVLGGFGMPPLTNNIQPWANAPGSYFQNLKILNRVVTMTFHAKNESRLIGSPKLNNLYELRQQLIDIIKPDKTQGSEAFLFEYDDGERPLYMRFRYEAGLEGEWDIRNQWVNSFPIRLLAVDPFWTEDNQNVADLDFSETISTGATEKDAFQRVNGIWSSMPNPATTGYLDNSVLGLAVGPKGEVYACGSFTGAYGYSRIAKWDGVKWVPLSNGLANGDVNAIAVAPDGTIYAVGAFTSIGGVACTRVAKYNPTTDTWSALSTGLNDVGRSVCIAPNGQVYMGGDFTTAGGVTMNYITRWDGLQFRTVGSPTGVSATVRALVNAGDGNTMYMAGDFTSAAPTFYARIASINLTTNLLTQISGVNNSVYALAVGKDGTLYAGGSFTTQGAAPTLDRKRIAYIQGGNSWQLGDGFADGQVNGLSVGPDGALYAVGTFTLSGTIPTIKLAKWSKGAWVPLDFIPNKGGTTSVSIMYSVLAHPNGDLYVGGDAIFGQTYVSGITTITNEGTAEVQPQIYVSGPGTLRFLENWATKKRVYFNLTLFSGEEVFIDFAKSSITSNQRGSLMGYVLNGSDFKSFSLLPGPNQIAAFMIDDVAGLMKIGYVPQHWSADAVIDAEELA